MAEVTIRELRNQGGRVVDRVMAGEHVTITRDGRPVAELLPLGHAPLSAEELLSRWRGLPRVDPHRLRADLDGALDPSL